MRVREPQNFPVKHPGEPDIGTVFRRSGNFLSGIVRQLRYIILLSFGQGWWTSSFSLTPPAPTSLTISPNFFITQFVIPPPQAIDKRDIMQLMNADTVYMTVRLIGGPHAEGRGVLLRYGEMDRNGLLFDKVSFLRRCLRIGS